MPCLVHQDGAVVHGVSQRAHEDGLQDVREGDASVPSGLAVAANADRHGVLVKVCHSLQAVQEATILPVAPLPVVLQA